LKIWNLKIKKNKAITFDVSESNQNLEAGKARDIIRSIQAERKKIGTKIDEFVKVTLPDWPKDFEEEIRKKALINNLSSGEFKVAKND